MTPTEFKSWRKRCGLTQAQAGNALGYTQQHICAIERGRFPVTRAIALATVGYECREKANDMREMLAFVERDYPGLVEDPQEPIKGGFWT